MKEHKQDMSNTQTHDNKGVETLLTIAQQSQEKEANNIPDVIKSPKTETNTPSNIDSTSSSFFTIQKILGGDILFSDTIRRQIWVFMLITLFVLAYIAARYSYQQKLIEIDKLSKELKDAKYKALSSTSLLTEKSRESNVLDMLKSTNDSVIKIANQPPYIINVPEE